MKKQFFLSSYSKISYDRKWMLDEENGGMNGNL
jgi:hypothetical protein